jgi:hypothetical protein
MEPKDLKPLPEQPEPVVNPKDETQPQSTTSDGEGGNEGDADDPEPGGDHPKKRPDDPTP